MYTSYLKIPVAVYDVEDKKLVMLFDCKGSCAVYVFDKLNYAISNYLAKKHKCNKNRFNRTICFRHATKEQMERLGNNKVLILDERYSEAGKEKLLSGFIGLEDLVYAKGRPEVH
jgi:hypothetical protein